MRAFPYDDSFSPPAPVMRLRVRPPGSSGWIQFSALVDTGADITVIPADVADRRFPLAGVIDVHGVTGDVEEAVLYRVDLDFAGIRRAAVVAGLGSEPILGRDLLEHTVLRLDGPARRLTVKAGR
jgi:predicted aspartyl protease